MNALKRMGIDPDGGGQRMFVSGHRVEVIAPVPVDETEIRLLAAAVTPSSWPKAYQGLFSAAIRD